MSNLKPSKYINLQPFQAWVQQSLPAVYDDSLSYTDLLAKMLAYLNNLVENNNTLSTDVTNAINYINTFFESTDFQDKVDDKLNRMASDGSLSRLIQPLFDAYKEQIDGTVATQNTNISNIQSQQNVLKQRMDTFTQLPSGSTSGDAELQDIRVGANSVTYSTAGDAVRGQYSQLKEDLDTNLLDMTLVLKGWSNGTGFVDANDVMSPGTVLQSTNYDVVVTTDFSKYVVSIYYYSSPTNKYPTWKANASAPYTIPKGQYFSIIIRYKNNIETLAQEDIAYIPTVTKCTLQIGVWNAISDMNNEIGVIADTIVVFGYSKWGSRYPIIKYQNPGYTVYVDGFVNWQNIYTGKAGSISTYNTTPNTFTLTSGESLVFDKKDNTLKVVNTINSDYIVLLLLNSNKIPSGGQWLSYLTEETDYKYYNNPQIPYSPRNVVIEQSDYAGDQSICELGNWLICFNAQDSNGLVYILNKDTKDRIKTMSHTLGHANMLSYCTDTDSLMISGAKSYILQNATAFIDNESNTAINPSDCVAFDIPIGVFGETNNVSYCPIQGTADTLNNYSIKKYILDMSGDLYTGTYTEENTYTANYRTPVTQDAKFYNGFLYQGVGYRKASVYKISFDNVHNGYKIEESYDIPNSDIYELEGVCVRSGELLISVRLVADITQKYFITVER